ncbi:hypothetical protein F5Y02DRAFT_426524 [Annulohypoxylon stygium]|nr:hypothetical protein F5Y02DRAFT_426524 [Annulohypoxylon stygium]
MPEPGKISKAQAWWDKCAAKRQKRQQYRKDVRATAANHPRQAPAQKPLPPAPRTRSNWEAYATDKKLSGFDKFKGGNQQALPKEKATLTQALKPRREASHQQFGVAGDRDRRFAIRTHEARQTIKGPNPGPKSLQDVLKKYPDLEFPGINKEILNALARHINEVTLEVTLKWVRKWCAGMKLSHVSLYAPDSHPVPTEALDLRFTKRKKVTEVFGDYRQAWAAHGNKQDPRDVASLAEASIVLCRVLKDSKTADAINKVKDATLWLNANLGGKLLDFKREASQRLQTGIAESIVVSLLSKSYDVQRLEFDVKLLKEDKELIESYWGRNGEDNPDPVPYPGDSDKEDGEISSKHAGNSDRDPKSRPSDGARKSGGLAGTKKVLVESDPE